MNMKLSAILVLAYLIFTPVLSVSSPTWSTDCGFKRYIGKYVKIGVGQQSLPDLTDVETELECREKCGENPKCGMYAWDMRRSTKCLNSQQSLQLWKEAGVPEEILWDHTINLDRYVTGVRDCDAFFIRDECNFQRNHLMPNALPHSVRDDAIIAVNTEDSSGPSLPPSITAEVCQTMCSFYKECKGTVLVLRGEHEFGFNSVCGLLASSLSDVDVNGESYKRERTDYYYYDKICQ